jgi:hypothetical protein
MAEAPDAFVNAVLSEPSLEIALLPAKKKNADQQHDHKMPLVFGHVPLQRSNTRSNKSNVKPPEMGIIGGKAYFFEVCNAMTFKDDTKPGEKQRKQEWCFVALLTGGL